MDLAVCTEEREIEGRCVCVGERSDRLGGESQRLVHHYTQLGGHGVEEEAAALGAVERGVLLGHVLSVGMWEKEKSMFGFRVVLVSDIVGPRC